MCGNGHVQRRSEEAKGKKTRKYMGLWGQSISDQNPFKRDEGDTYGASSYTLFSALDWFVGQVPYTYRTGTTKATKISPGQVCPPQENSTQKRYSLDSSLNAALARSRTLQSYASPFNFVASNASTLARWPGCLASFRSSPGATARPSGKLHPAHGGFGLK